MALLRQRLEAMKVLATLLGTLFALACSQDIQKPASFIVNGANTTSGRYPYFVSLRYLELDPRNRTAAFQPFCGGSLISDRLVLTAAHCAMDSEFLQYYATPLPSDFRKLGFSFTAFPNTYLLTQGLQLSAYVGATSRAANGTGNPIQAWFTHPWFDPTNLYYDIAVGLLANPVPNVQKVKLFNPPGDIYSQLSSTINITAIGLGDVDSDDYAEIEDALNPNFVDTNNNTARQLAEAVVGTLTPRVLCGKALTANAQRNSTDGSGNDQFGQLATTIGPGQMCIGEADNAAIDARMRQQAAQIVSSANKLPSSVVSDLNNDGVDPTSLQQVIDIIPGYNDSCQGDSGSSVIVKGADSTSDVQIGTVSYGVGCGSGISGVYNSVQAFLNSTTFDSFLMDVLTAVPNQNGVSSLSNLVTSLPGMQSGG